MEEHLDQEIDNPFDAAEWEEFLNFLARLRDVVARHFVHEELDHARLADFIWKRRLSCLSEFWKKDEVLRDLAQLRKSLKLIEQILQRLPDGVSTEIQTEALRPLLGKKKPATSKDQDKSMAEVIAELPSMQALEALRNLEGHIPRILPLISAAERKAKNGYPVGNKALEAWRTVEACVDLCEAIPGFIDVPKAMGSSGKFYRFLSDVFLAIGLEADPEAAFKGWRRHVVRKEKENW